MSISTIKSRPLANVIQSSKYFLGVDKMLIYSKQHQWVPIIVVLYCSHEIADGFQYYTPFVQARGSTEGESKAHQCKFKLWELRYRFYCSFAVKVETWICRLEVILLHHDPLVGVFFASCYYPID